ncbi:hypothetical protein D3C73_1444140 [compost metagenome]
MGRALRRATAIHRAGQGAAHGLGARETTVGPGLAEPGQTHFDRRNALAVIPIARVHGVVQNLQAFVQGPGVENHIACPREP